MVAKTFVRVFYTVFRSSLLKGIRHPLAHVRQFDFLSDGTVFKVDICDKNPSPSTLRGV